MPVVYGFYMDRRKPDGITAFVQ